MEAGDVDDSLYCSTRTMGRRTIDTSQWASPDEGALEGSRRALYFARKEAVSLYLSGATADTIKHLTSLGAKQASVQAILLPLDGRKLAAMTAVGNKIACKNFKQNCSIGRQIKRFCILFGAA
ncbi:hypothetical protein P5W99_37705 [Paraburkholderia sp. A3BS-1L]|uniref:hypothetical protein n=1 Tax=Paraburkholderia sp. A3BS-1L TaxID=3028375 RepID=UPI003DA9074C